MAQKVRITYYGMEGEGRTLTEAKRDAGQKIEKALEGDYNPVSLSFGSRSALVYRMPSGWGYRLLPQDQEESVLYASANGSRDESITRARYHLAQLGWNGANDEQTIAFVKTRENQMDLKGWITWQRRYMQAAAEGHNDVDAHRMACGF